MVDIVDFTADSITLGLEMYYVGNGEVIFENLYGILAEHPGPPGAAVPEPGTLLLICSSMIPQTE